MKTALKAAFAFTGCLFVATVLAQQAPRYTMSADMMPNQAAPALPSDYHWLDWSRSSSSVVTVGYVWRNLKLEGSAFTAREREDTHVIIGSPKPFSLTSGRLSFNPSPNWVLQLSRGQRNRPDQLDPNDEVRRTTVSAIYNGSFEQNNWQTTLAFGRSAKRITGSTNAYLLESVLKLKNCHTYFGRAERTSNDELFNEGETLHGQVFSVSKLTLGYVHDIASTGPITLGIGALASKRFVPPDQVASFGRDRASYKMFVRVQLQFP